ncbi:glycosyltransferase family 2 protein [Enterovibrio norvegicus]|uniref:Glycosyltransferase family 2 protein n=2 Tax=Enterovibrio norvegicus TaxID=188144 RepID=A0ABV4L4K1_9GAMM
MPKVTVFVPFFNEEKDALQRTLDSIDAQIYPSKLQVLLIDDGSTNNSRKHVSEWLSVKRNHEFTLLKKPVNGGRKGVALDYALELNVAVGDIYVVVDSDTCVDTEGICELAAKMETDPRYAAVCGFIAPDNHHDNLLTKLQHYEHIGYYGAIRYAQDKLGLVPVLAGAFVAHRATVVKEIGGWSEWLVEDIAWCWRAISHNYRTGYAPRAIASTQCPTTHKGLFNQRRRWARGRVEAYLAAWKVSFLSGISSTPWFVITTLQYLFPPGIFLIPVLVMLGMYIPIGFGLATYIIYFNLFQKFQLMYPSHNRSDKRNIIKITASTILLESIVWLPNLLGYLDELVGKKKSWLTR